MYLIEGRFLYVITDLPSSQTNVNFYYLGQERSRFERQIQHLKHCCRFPLVLHLGSPTRFLVPPGSPSWLPDMVLGSPRFPTSGPHPGSRFPPVPPFGYSSRFPVPHGSPNLTKTLGTGADPWTLKARLLRNSLPNPKFLNLIPESQSQIPKIQIHIPNPNPKSRNSKFISRIPIPNPENPNSYPKSQSQIPKIQIHIPNPNPKSRKSKFISQIPTQSRILGLGLGLG